MLSGSWLLGLYRIGGMLLAPVAVALCLWRLARGQEERGRLGERFGFDKEPRPDGRLVWLHGASIGEVVALLPLVRRLLEADAQLQVLITSTTKASAHVLQQRMPTRCRHRYITYDYPGAVGRFLRHWRPDLAVWTESELWPHLILATHARGIPMAQVSAYMSKTSHRRWSRAPQAARALLNCFSLCLARDVSAAARLRDLLGREIDGVVNLKETGLDLPYDANELAALQGRIAQRPCWLATNSHEGEEMLLARAHKRLLQRHPDLLLLLAPRRCERARTLVRELEALVGGVGMRSQQPLPDASSHIYVIDSFGELGLFYRAASLVFLGGSLIPQGGHNPLEPARLNCLVLHGEHVDAYADLFDALDTHGGGERISNEDTLVEAIEQRLQDPQRLQRESAAAAVFARERGSGVVDNVTTRLLALMDS